MAPATSAQITPTPMQDLITRLHCARDARAEPLSALGRSFDATLDQALRVLTADHQDPGDPNWPLHRIAASFGLDEDDARLLWAAAAPSLDASVGIAVAALQNGGRETSVALALELCDIGSATPEAHGRLGAASTLVRHGLVSVIGEGPWLDRRLTVPDLVLSALAGCSVDSPTAAALRVDVPAVDLDGARAVAHAIRLGEPLVWVRERQGTSGAALAGSALSHLGHEVWTVDLRRVPAAELASTAAHLTLEAGLQTVALVVLVGAERAEEPQLSGFIGVLERAAVPVVAVANRAWNPDWSARHPLVIEATALSRTQRYDLWRTHLRAGFDDELRELLSGLRLPAERIAEAASLARRTAAAQGRGLDADLVTQAVRSLGAAGLTSTGAASTLLRTAPPHFSDLVVPDHLESSLRRLVSWARHRDDMTASGLLRGRGHGLAALFTGNPGTGKTLAANVVAAELGVELFQVDLSTVVDKYIGETEKKLERIFQTAEAMDVVLFFDEADALFGSRTSVQDARDRYANQEVSFLLQRMEQFEGIALLSTNLRGNVDKAFARRLSFILHFPDPDIPTRARLWNHHLDQVPEQDPHDPVDVMALATACELAGGDIRNIVLGAAYDAVSQGLPLANRHVLVAALREHTKLGRVPPPLLNTPRSLDPTPPLAEIR